MAAAVEAVGAPAAVDRTEEVTVGDEIGIRLLC